MLTEAVSDVSKMAEETQVSGPVPRRRRTAAEMKRTDSQAFALRVAGATLSDIAQALGYRSVSGVDAAINRHLGETATDVEEVRRMENARLDAMQAAIWPRAIGRRGGGGVMEVPADLEAIGKVLQIMAHRARINGLHREPMADLDAELRELAKAEGWDEAEVLQEAERIVGAANRRGGRR